VGEVYTKDTVDGKRERVKKKRARERFVINLVIIKKNKRIMIIKFG